jgi:hypothetical protein
LGRLGVCGLVTTTIWVVVSLGNEDREYFWPIWVAGPWGAVLLARTLFGNEKDRPGRKDGERDHH